MERATRNNRKVCILSKNEISSISNFLSFKKSDTLKRVCFSNFTFTEIEKFNPDVIIIDDYYAQCNYTLIINTLIEKFQNTKIFIISPEFTEYNEVIRSYNSENHFFSNLNEKVISHIDSTQGKSSTSYLSAC